MIIGNRTKVHTVGNGQATVVATAADTANTTAIGSDFTRKHTAINLGSMNGIADNTARQHTAVGKQGIRIAVLKRKIVAVTDNRANAL